MTTVSRPIAKSGSALLVSQLGLLAINLLTTIYILRLLSKTEFAVVAVLDILISIITFTDLGLLAVAIQKAPAELQPGKDPTPGLALIKCAVWYRSLALLLAGALSIFFASEISQWLLKTPDYAWAVRMLAPAAMGVIWYQTFQGVAQIKNDFYLFARWDIVVGVLRPALSILGYLAYGLPGFLIGTTISIYISVLGLGWSLRDFFINKAPLAPLWSTLRYGLPFYLRGFARFGFLQYDQLVVATLLTPEILASYTVVRRLTKFIFMMTESFQTPITMRMTALRIEADALQAKFFVRSTRYLTMIIVPLAGLLAAASPWVMLVYGGEKYAAEWPLLILLLAAQVAYTFYSVMGSAVFARLKPLASLVVDGIVGGANFVLAPLLVFLLGKYGIAWGQIIGFCAGILCARIMLGWKSAFKYDWSVWRLIGVPLLLACAILIAGQVIFAAWWIVPIYGVAACSLFLHLTLRKLPEEDWQQVQTIAPRFLLPAISKVQQLYGLPVIERG
jgi:O-antigen/teichoic acid export membrane protein